MSAKKGPARSPEGRVWMGLDGCAVLFPVFESVLMLAWP